MSQSSWSALWEKLGLAASQPSKRTEKGRIGWGTQTEQLENRALLSAATCPVDPNAPAETAVQRNVHERKKPPVVFPTINGTWDVTVTGGQFNGATGSAVISVTRPKATRPPVITSVVNITGVPAIHSSGKFNTKNNHLIEGSANLDIPGFGNHKVNLTITFDPGNDPQHFTGKVAIGKAITLATFTGTLRTTPPV